MRFGLIDRVIELEPARRIVAIKAVSLSEEYLSEHFPTFPVLPGVFMLEAMVEAAGWLVRAARDFDRSVILLASTRSVTYKRFVEPGHLLRVEVGCRRMAPETSEFAGACYCGDTEAVKGRFTLRHFNLADRSPALAATDRRIVDEARKRWALLYRGADGDGPS